MLNLQPQYEYKTKDLLYYFTTDSGVIYTAYFLVNNDIPNGYEFCFDCEERNVKYYDEKIKNTICNILLSFFTDKENAIIYVCSNSDKKALPRKRLFNKWFDEINDMNIIHLERDLTTNYYDIHASLLIVKDNPLKEYIIDLFEEQIKLLTILDNEN